MEKVEVETEEQQHKLLDDASLQAFVHVSMSM